MPTVLRSGPVPGIFFSHGPNEPPHVHVDRDDLSVKFWLQPLALARNFGFPPRELRQLRGAETYSSFRKFFAARQSFYLQLKRQVDSTPAFDVFVYNPRMNVPLVRLFNWLRRNA